MNLGSPKTDSSKLSHDNGYIKEGVSATEMIAVRVSPL